VANLELTRASEDRRLYSLEGVGTLRLKGLMSRAAVARADAQKWQFARRGFWQRRIDATDETGARVDDFEPRGLRRGGTVRWDGRELTLRAASNRRERYALADETHELALLDGKDWDRRPVQITVDAPSTIDPGLLLFAAYIVRWLAEEGSGAAGGGATAAVSGGG
jgi:hypothetical protein